MANLFRDMPNVKIFLDDLLIAEKSKENHLATLDKIFSRLNSHGMKIKQNKCIFLADEVNYLGFIIGKEGIRPDPEKLQAIQKMPRPTNVTELRSFIGMINFYAKFVRDLSSLLYPLYNLLKKGRPWLWDQSCGKAFGHVKKVLLSSEVLAHYDPSKPVIVTCDASGRGVGGVLSQPGEASGERAVVYASRKLTDAEKNYSQIHREALAIIFCVKKFHQYLYGRHFILRTDHKPLVSIFGSQAGIPSMAASRMQRWAIILSAYDYDIQYIRTQCNGADALSRLPIEGSERESSIEQSYLHFASEALLLNSEEIKRKTLRDPLLSRVLSYLKDGWPHTVNIRELQPYYNRRNELYTEFGCIMWGHRLVVPETCREIVLRELHEPHMGIVKTKAIARSYVWWPGIDEALEARCRACSACCEVAPAPPLAPPAPWRWPQRPYDRVHLDFLGPINGHTYLITVDARTKWIEVFKMTRTTAECTIDKLRESWSRWGLPRLVVSDNGPPFTSDRFKQFLTNNGIRQMFTAPYHPASNGAAENAVKIIKKVIKKASFVKQDVEASIYRFLLNYHNTPHSTTGEAPAFLLQGRHLRTRLDAIKPDRCAKVEAIQEQYAQRKPSVIREDRGMSSGDTVWVRSYRPNRKWCEGIVTERLGKANYTIGLRDGSSVHRHVDQMKRRWSCPLPCPPPESKDRVSIRAVGEAQPVLSESAVEPIDTSVNASETLLK